MLTPWRAILSPRGQSSPLADCSGLSFWTTFALHTFLLVGMMIAVMVWSDTFTTTWDPVELAEGNLVHVGQQRTWSQSWTDWVSGPGPGPYLTAMLLAGLVFVGHVVLAWVYLPDTHEGGSVVRSFGRAFRGVAGSIGMLTVLATSFGLALVKCSHFEVQVGSNDWEGYFAFAGFVLFGVQVSWIRWTCGGVRRAEDASVLPPMCEDCGYDLTHRPESGRCTECGGDINTSLTPGARRNACAWEQPPGALPADPPSSRLSGLGGVVSSLIIDPVRFYQGLVMCSGTDRAVAFARWQYALMGTVAATWMLIIGLCDGFSPDDLLGAVTFMPVLTIFLGWGVHRTVGAIALSYCFVRGVLPDPRYARKVLAYETAFLWVFCAYDGCLMTSVFIWNTWMSDLLGRGIGWLGGMPPEVAAVLFGNGAIALGWLYRYRLIIPQVRWANF